MAGDDRGGRRGLDHELRRRPAAIVKLALSFDTATVGSIAISVNGPARLIVNPLNVATPRDATVEARVDPSANAPLASTMVTVELSVVITLPYWSSTSTVTSASAAHPQRHYSAPFQTRVEKPLLV